VILLLIPAFAYIAKFGAVWSSSHEVWGQFGDFFGGLLNPLYAMLAFFAVLYNVRLQAEQLAIAKEEFHESARSTQAQIEALKARSDREELLSVIRASVASIEAAYNEIVSPQGASPVIQLHHVIHEGWRLRFMPVKGGPFDEYVRNANTAGTLIQALHARLEAAADSLAHFTALYEATYGTGSPVLAYYRKRFVGLGVLLERVTGNKAETVNFFLSAEREDAI
jgi:hypothetical protein